MAGIVVRALCLVVLAITLTAGLWPFHAPKNEVRWLGDGNGLQFGRRGSVVSESPLATAGSRTGSSCSLELWLEPAQFDGQGTILGFYDPLREMVPFRLRQFGSGLALHRLSRDESAGLSEILVNGVFRGTTPVFITIRSGATGMSVFVDGNLLQRVSYFSFSSRDLSGQLVVGDVPVKSFNWSGTVKGLAVYNRELTDAEVSEEFANWTKGVRPKSAKETGVVARYFFDEGKGSVVRNQVQSATNLIIPTRFMVLHQRFLERPWEEFRTAWYYWKDVAVNVVGLIPLGFVFRGYFGSMFNLRRPTLLAIAFGFAVSLTIEVLQSFLPTRDSGMTDLITNTFGTALGAVLFAWLLKKRSITVVVLRREHPSAANLHARPLLPSE